VTGMGFSGGCFLSCMDAMAGRGVLCRCVCNLGRNEGGAPSRPDQASGQPGRDASLVETAVVPKTLLRKAAVVTAIWLWGTFVFEVTSGAAGRPYRRFLFENDPQ